MVKGDKVNFLTMISEPTKGTRPKAMFLCECGTVKEIRIDNVSSGNTKSCGCKNRELHKDLKSNYRHGGHGTRIYNIYHKMKARCCNPNYSESQYYGSRGIKICDEWLRSFETFRRWAMSHGYADNLTIDRIDTNKGYTPDNCRWTSPKQQSRNKRNNITITHNGKTQILVEWCEELGLPFGTIAARIRRGWDKEKAITEPVSISRKG